MATIGTVARLMVEMSAAGVAETGAQVRNVGTEAEHTTAKMGIMKRFMGSFLGQQLIFGLISKAIQVISENIQDVGTQTNAWDAQLAQLNSVLKSTGDASGVTSTMAINLADQLSKVSLNSNSAVLSAENMLLTFTAIGKDTFPAATQAVIDMQQAMQAAGKNMSLGDVAVQVGKALQDPILGMTTLRREGVNFSKAQTDVVKKMVDTGHTAQAQAYILAELNREFGGSAKAATTTFAGSLQVVNQQMDIVKENIGNALMPVLAQLFLKIAPLATSLGNDLPRALQTFGTFFNTYLKTPLTDVKNIVGDLFGALGTLIGGFVSVTGPANDMGKAPGDAHDALKTIDDIIRNNLAPAMKPLGEDIGHVVTALLGFTQWIKDNKTVLLFIGAFIGVILVDALYSMAAAAIAANLALLPEELIFLAIAAAIALLVVGVVELVTHWKDIVKFLGDFAGAVGNFIGNMLGAVGDFADKLIDLYTWPYRTLWDHIGPFVKGLLGFLGNFFGTVIGITLRFDALLLGLLTFPFRFAWAFIQPLLGFLLGKLGDFFGMVLGKVGDLGGVIYGFVKGPIGGLLGSFGALKDMLGNVAGWLGDFIGGAFYQFGRAWQALGTLISNIWPGIQSGLKTGLNVVIGVLNGFIEFIDKIQIHIPTVNVGPVHSPSFDWGGMGIPTIPLLASGGNIVSSGSVIVGDPFSPERIDLPAGARVTPLGMRGAQDMSNTRKGPGSGETHYHVHVNASQATAGEVMLQMRKQEMLHRGLVR